MEVSQDIGFEIFSWLPAKSICKFKSTCNPFSKFSEETVFRTKQTQNLFGKDDTCLFIQPDEISQKYVTKRVELYSLHNHQQSSGAPNNVLSFLSNTASVIASCNGLVLCHHINDPAKVFICNPITKFWSFIPISESIQINNNFANAKLMLHCSLDDYKVFLFENTMEWGRHPTCYTCSVYHGKEGVWKTMERGFLPGERNIEFDMPVFYNGALYFISDSGQYFARPSPFYKPYIMSYNLENGISTMFRLPREAIKGFHLPCKMGIFNWGKASNSNGSICLVKLRKSTFTVWFLGDYESCSWEKVFKTRVRAMGLKEKDPYVTAFTVVNGNRLVFATEERVYSCCLDKKRFMKIEEICQHNCGFNPRFISYLDTYRSCGINAETMPC
ncbi:F-box protein CPR1 [Trifolium repens]|nr:F-box protein CPR1 [Trifolium repens]